MMTITEIEELVADPKTREKLIKKIRAQDKKRNLQRRRVDVGFRAQKVKAATTCEHCQRNKAIHMDHVIPIWLWQYAKVIGIRLSSIDNRQDLCSYCHNKKNEREARLRSSLRKARLMGKDWKEQAQVIKAWRYREKTAITKIRQYAEMKDKRDKEENRDNVQQIVQRRRMAINRHLAQRKLAINRPGEWPEATRKYVETMRRQIRRAQIIVS